jgi:ribosome-associated protein
MASLFALGMPIEVDERFVRASGPGGQNVNKVATAVELRFDVMASPLPEDVKRRLIALAGRRLISGNVVLIDSREYRTQTGNRDAARARLLSLIEDARRVPKKRTATRPKRSAREKRLKIKKARSDVKRGRGRTSDED